ncbi:THUMP domain-containing protein [Polyangium sp. 6x1]|uniref:THUMP domain-containing class I SAM-dependent RNA methyltransferase n=1 Tax=Polyangium sp. 6x1 TaxID=3042689 RepID=UPI002482C614|nr:THUMP domain-containing protein [Polyangium sp. 6x1]MDI1447077.1 THUMP domain-containing protein [Polyangium sp. 6x1]
MRTERKNRGEVMRFFATAAKGTEGALRDELREGRFREVRADRGGVHFEGPIEEGMRACLTLRIAVRVLAQLAEFEAASGEALYEGVSRVDFSPYVDPKRTLAVRAACKDSRLTHTQFIAQKTKDAIVDQERKQLGARSSVDLDDPDLSVFVHVVRDRASLYVDLAGESLHRRGYRTRIEEAPLKETLAAAILRLSGWDRQSPLVDPMCGSGTIPIEAALWARDVAPGLLRPRHGFERWPSHDETRKKRIAEMREAARAQVKSEGPFIAGSDVSPQAIETAKQNAKAAGVRMHFSRADVRDVEPLEPPGFIVTNPPYGERLTGGEELYRGMADAFRRLSGHTVVLLAGTPEISRAMRIRPDKEITVWNGPIECRLFSYSIR